MAARIKAWRFTVQGSRAFPLDMLRYDACYPAATSDVTKIDESQHSETRAPGEVSIDLVGRVHNPTHARWNSFGWKITKEVAER
jgi:hypothetical protein